MGQEFITQTGKSYLKRRLFFKNMSKFVYALDDGNVGKNAMHEQKIKYCVFY